MVSSAHISYPTADEDDDRRQTIAAKPEDDAKTREGEPDDFDEPGSFDEEDDLSEEDDERDIIEGIWPESVPISRVFDISPEEFCGDPYEQQGHIETRQELGKKGEDAAVAYLRARGFEILKRNWFCQYGEADIIARDEEDTLCFIEVKTRRSIEAGLPEEAITEDKRRRYEQIALCFMTSSDEWHDNDAVRFDAIGICVTGPHKALLRHHRNCFNASV